MKNYISLFFLAGFLFFRVGNLHAATHAYSDKEKSACELCDLIAHTNKSVTLDLGPVPIEVPNRNIEEKLQLRITPDYSAPKVAILFFIKNYNRPPPFSTLG